MKNLELGSFGEQIAAKYLLQKGYLIIEKNFRNRWGEIDLIVKDNAILVFVEVKTRTSLKFGHPNEAVNFYKLRALKRSLEFYILKNQIDTAVRLDVISILVVNGKALLKHFKNVPIE